MQLLIKKMRWFGAVNVIYSALAIVMLFVLSTVVIVGGGFITSVVTFGKVEISGERISGLLEQLIVINKLFIFIGIAYLILSFIIKKYAKPVLFICIALVIYSFKLLYDYAMLISFFDNMSKEGKTLFIVYGIATGVGLVLFIIFIFLLLIFFFIHIYFQLKIMYSNYKIIKNEKI